MSQIPAQNPSERKQQKQTNGFTLDTVESFLYYPILYHLSKPWTKCVMGQDRNLAPLTHDRNPTVRNIELRDWHL